VRGLLAPLASKNGWTLAEAAGDATPDGMQRLLNAAAWDADGVRDDVRGYVARHLGGVGGVLVVDETGFVKKGTRSAGCSGSTPEPPAGRELPARLVSRLSKGPAEVRRLLAHLITQIPSRAAAWGLVHLAKTPPAPRQNQPLSAKAGDI
jgi:hypothetical protein